MLRRLWLEDCDHDQPGQLGATVSQNEKSKNVQVQLSGQVLAPKVQLSGQVLGQQVRLSCQVLAEQV